VTLGRYGQDADDMTGSGNGSSIVTFSDGHLHMNFTERTVGSMQPPGCL